MIPALIARLIASGVPARLAKPLLIAGAVIGAALLLWFVVTHIIRNHDEAVIEKHDAKLNTESLERSARVNEITADARVKDAVTAERSKAELKKVIADETKPIDDRRRALRDCVRLQQRAAKAGLPVPECR